MVDTGECVGQLDEPFRRSEIVGWFRRHHPDVNQSTLAAHIQAATANAANRVKNNPLGARPPLLRRVDHGLYVRAGRPRESVVNVAVQVNMAKPQTGRGADADVVLVGCVRTKRAAASAASELFTSPLFEGQRRSDRRGELAAAAALAGLGDPLPALGEELNGGGLPFGDNTGTEGNISAFLRLTAAWRSCPAIRNRPPHC